MTPRSITLPARTLVIGALVLVLGGAALHASLAHPGTVTQTKPAPRTTSAGPNVERDGLLAGFTHNQAGALTAATTYVREGQRVFDLPPAGRTAALRSIAASAAADGFVADQAAQLTELDGAAQRGTGPLTWMVTVLATRMDAYTPQRARVSLWRVGILSVDGMSSPLAEWTTVDYELRLGIRRLAHLVRNPSPRPHPAGRPKPDAVQPIAVARRAQRLCRGSPARIPCRPAWGSSMTSSAAWAGSGARPGAGQSTRRGTR